MTRPAYQVILASMAGRDFLKIVDWSEEHFGADAANRYEKLIGQALIDLGENPFRLGSKERVDLRKGIHIYHLASSRKEDAGDRVKRPRHFVLYRVVSSRVEVLRILHDSRDLAQHLSKS